MVGACGFNKLLTTGSATVFHSIYNRHIPRRSGCIFTKEINNLRSSGGRGPCNQPNPPDLPFTLPLHWPLSHPPLRFMRLYTPYLCLHLHQVLTCAAHLPGDNLRRPSTTTKYHLPPSVNSCQSWSGASYLKDV